MILKRKFRYILVESSIQMDWKALSAEISNKLSAYLGERFYINADPRVVANCGSNAFILRVNRGSEQDAVLGTCYIIDINGSAAGLYTIKTSGTMRSLLDYASRAYK